MCASGPRRVDGAARQIVRHGYTVNRRAGRYAVFPRTAVAGLRRKIGTGRRAGRDLERHALLLAACGAGRRGSSSSITSTPKCGTWCSRPGWPASAARSKYRIAPPFYRRSRDRHAVGLGQGRSGHAGSGIPPIGSRSSRPGSTRASSRRAAQPDPAGGRRGAPGPGQAVRPLHRGDGRAAGRSTRTSRP